MKKYSLFALIFAIAFWGWSKNTNTVLADDSTATVPSAVGADSDAVSAIVSAPSTPDSSGSTVDNTGAIIPGTQGTTDTETGAIIPGTQGTTGNETGAIIPTAQGSDADDASTNAPVAPPSNPGGGGGTPPPSGGGGSITSSGSFSGGGSSSSSGGGSILPLTAPLLALNQGTSSCPLITVIPLKFGGNNDSAQVASLQAYLKEAEGLDVDVNGTFDQRTLLAVRNFQAKYVSDIMGPWGVNTPSGEVYITTKNKLNELACAQPIALTSAEQAIIAAYRAENAGSTAAAAATQGSTASTTGTTTSPLAPDVGFNSTTSPNQALVGAAAAAGSVWDSIWNLIKRIF